MVGVDGIRVHMDERSVLRLIAEHGGPGYRAVEGACIRVQAEATRLCPVDTGRLRASISYGIDEDATGLVGYVGSNVEYAAFVEWDQPYLRPAMDAA